MSSAWCPDGKPCEHEQHWAHPCDRDEDGTFMCERLPGPPKIATRGVLRGLYGEDV
jgi:hypothetical protein